MKKKIAVFTDFDGTITKKDIGDVLFKEYSVFEPYHTQLKAGELKIEEYWKILCKNMKEGVTMEDIRNFALSIEIDSNFKAFADFCHDRDMPLTVVSDGFDAYIHPILENLDLGHLKVHCNKLMQDENGYYPVYPGASESCTCLCASCKRNSVINSVDDDTIMVYIGDGYSDFCGAKHCDIIFAKKDLAAYCNENRLPHYPFKNFFDVRRILEKNIEQGKIRQRHQAFLNRKRAFEEE